MSFSRRWFLAGTSALAITVLSPISAALPANARTEINLLSPAEASSAAQSGQWKILDVRPVPPLDYISGHLPNAVHLSEQAFRGPNGKLPFQIWPAGDLANLLSRAGISNRDKVLVYSDGTNVLGASLVAYILEKSGVSKVGILDGASAPTKPPEPRSRRSSPATGSARSSPPRRPDSRSACRSCFPWWAARMW
nr:rhodanese-like domain-containing protein [Synechococcus sp. GFB01]